MAGNHSEEARAKARSVYFETLKNSEPSERLSLLAKEVEQERNRRASAARIPDPRTRQRRNS